MLRSFFAKEQGQSLKEYALVLGLIALVSASIIYLLYGKVAVVFSNIANEH